MSIDKAGVANINLVDYLPPLEPETYYRAGLTVCRLTETPEEAKEVLDMLGLTERLKG